MALVLRLRPWRRAAWVFLLPAWLGLSAGLSGCAGLAAGNAEMPVTGPDPSYQGVVATHLKQVLKNYSAYDSFEVSDPRWVHSIKGWTWLTCVRFRDQDRVRSYALFLDGNKIVDDRFAVQTDSCDLQTYYPFERMWRRPSLKELGVASIGHRVKLLDAIAALRTDARPSADVATTSSSPTAPSEDRAERRQVTVMFSDLVGSTALSARMDPEDLREVISSYQKCVTETVQRFGGFVAKYMGDGVLIYFGYPQAHEDDAERAVRAGLELRAAVTGLKTHAALQTRVGIATGLVVVGDLIGSGASQEQAIVGETPNLAARLQSIAEPNRLLIAESTRKLVGNLFELEDLGAKNLKGILGPIRAWAALRPASVEGRFEAMHATGLTDLVGREEELDLRCDGGPRRRPAKVRSCSCQARQALASLD